MDASHAAVGPVDSQEGDNTMQLFPNVVGEGVDNLADRLVDLNKTPLNSSEMPAAPLTPVMQHAPTSSAHAFIFGANRTVSVPSVNAASDDGHSGCYEATSRRKGATKAGHAPGHICKRAADMQRDLKRLKRENKLLKKELDEARAAAAWTGDDDEESTFRLPVFTNPKRHDRYMPTINKELRRTVRECLRRFAEEEATAAAKKRRQRALRDAAVNLLPTVPPHPGVSSPNANNVNGAGPSTVDKGKMKCEDGENEVDQQEELERANWTTETDSDVLSADVFSSSAEFTELEADFADDTTDSSDESIES